MDKNTLKKSIYKTTEAPEFNKSGQYYIAMVTAELKRIDEKRKKKTGRSAITSITSRIKSPESIYQKICLKHYAEKAKNPIECVNDLLGVRGICCYIDDIFAIAEALVKNKNLTLLKAKDYIAKPKASGYRGIHLIFLCQAPGKKIPAMKLEVQLRTTAMDFWSELDYQLVYKKEENENRKKVGKKLQKQAKIIAEVDEEMVKIRKALEALE